MLSISKKLHGADNKSVADAYRAMSVGYDKLKDFDKCLEYEIMSYDIYKVTNHISESTCGLCDWIARDYLNKKKQEKEAKRYFTEEYGMLC